MKKVIWVLMAVMFVGSVVNAAVVIDDDFNDAAVSGANWNVSVWGSAKEPPFSYVQFNTTNRPSEMVLAVQNETSGQLGEVEATYKTGISASDAAAGPITQTLKLGTLGSGTGEMWLIGNDASSGEFDRNSVNGGYLRVTFSYSSGAVNIYRRAKGGTLQVLLSTTVALPGENDVISISYDSSNVASATFYDDSLGATTNLVSSPIAHGLDFAVDYANGAYTALSLYSYSANVASFHSVNVSAVPEPSTTVLLGLGALAYIKKRR